MNTTAGDPGQPFARRSGWTSAPSRPQHAAITQSS